MQCNFHTMQYNFFFLCFVPSVSMAAEKPIIQEMLEVVSIPIILLKSYEIEAFVMGHHVYKERWTPTIGEHLDAFMEPNNSTDKYAVATFQKGKKQVIGHLPLGKSGKFAKTIFYFLKANKDNKCQVEIVSKVVNQNDGLGMKVPSRLIFTAEEKYLKILKKELPELL